MSYSFSQTFGKLGACFIAIALLLFAYSTVLGWFHYGATACEYLFGSAVVPVYRLVYVAIVLAGSVIEAQLAWDISDTFNGLMMLPNLIGVLVLSPQVMKCTRNYIDRRINQKNIKPMLSMIPEIQASEELLIYEDDDSDSYMEEKAS
jgi:AGCS family alanine or glycine:cation symporter